MEISYAQLSATGPVRANNEDSVGFWQPSDDADRLARGAVAALADGVGGLGHGEVASHLAVETALRRFQDAPVSLAPSQVLSQIFKWANRAVHEAGVQCQREPEPGAAGPAPKKHGAARQTGKGADEPRLPAMATTLTVTVLRANKVTIGHIGDCRAYVLHEGRLQCVTTDHSYAGVQLKLGLISSQQAMRSPLRSVLTRALGPKLSLRADYHTVFVSAGDWLMQCTDGIHGVVPDTVIGQILTQHTPEEACQRLIDAAVERHGDDNMTVQIVRIDKIVSTMEAGSGLQVETVEPVKSGSGWPAKRRPPRRQAPPG